MNPKMDNPRFDPFRRTDAPLFAAPYYELFKTVVMLPLVPFRILSLIILLALYDGCNDLVRGQGCFYFCLPGPFLAAMRR